MVANTYQTTTYNHEEEGRFSITAVAILIGLFLGTMFNLIWQGLPLAAMAGMGFLGLAISFITVTIVHNQFRQESEWGLALVGQVLGVLAVGLIFIASII